MISKSRKQPEGSDEFLTNMTAEVNYKVSELSTSKAVNWTCHLDKHTKPKYSPYDLILGLALLTALKIVINFVNKTIK